MKIEFTTRGLLSAFFRQRQKFLRVAGAILVSGVVYLLFAQPQYESAGSLLVKFGTDAMPDLSRSDNRPQVISQNDRRETIQSNMDILQSHDLLLSVVREFGVEKLYPGISDKNEGNTPEEAAIRKLWKGDLSIKSSQQSNTIDVHLINGNPEVAAQFVHLLFAQFIGRQSEVFSKSPTNFLQDQVKHAQLKLDTSQRRLREFKARNGVSNIDDELNELLRQKSDAGTASLESIDDAWDRLSELQSQERQMLTTYRANSPQVKRIHANVELAKQQLKQRRADLAARTGHAKSEVDERIAHLEELRSEYDDLVRQVKIDEENYKNYQLRSEDARVNETLKRQNITPIAVIDEPVVQLKPIRPRKLLVLAMCLLASLVFGSGVALTWETFDQRFTTPEHIVQTLRVPVMATFAAPERL